MQTSTIVDGLVSGFKVEDLSGAWKGNGAWVNGVAVENASGKALSEGRLVGAPYAFKAKSGLLKALSSGSVIVAAAKAKPATERVLQRKQLVSQASGANAVVAPYGVSAKTGKALTAQQALMSYGKCKAQPKSVVDWFAACVVEGCSLGEAAARVLSNPAVATKAPEAPVSAKAPSVSSDTVRMAGMLRQMAEMANSMASMLEAM